MADGGALGGAGEAAVCDQGDGLVEAHAAHMAGGREHLAHAGAAGRALVADDDDVAGLNLAAEDGLAGVLLALEDAGGAAELHHLGCHGGLLHHGAVGREVAAHDFEAAVGRVGVVAGADDLAVDRRAGVDPLAHGAVDGEGAAVERAAAAELADDGRNAAHCVEVLDVERAGGGDAGDVGRCGADLVPGFEGDGAAGGRRDGGEVQHRVGGAAEGHVEGHAVADGGGGDDVLDADVLLDELHDLHAGLLGQAVAGGVDGGDGAVARQGDAQGLGKAADGVGGEHARAAAAGGAGRLLDPLALLLGHGAGGHLAHGVEEGVEVGLVPAVARAAGEHGAAGDEDRGEVEAQGTHDHARDDLVACRDQHHGVEGVALDGALDGVCDDLAAGEGVVHALVVHGDTVAHADGGHAEGGAASHADARLDVVDDALQMQVAGDNVVSRADDRHEGAVELLVREAVCLEQAAVRGTRQALLYLVASHQKSPSFHSSQTGEVRMSRVSVCAVAADCGYPTDPASGQPGGEDRPRTENRPQPDCSGLGADRLPPPMAWQQVGSHRTLQRRSAYKR